jgi:hypothetical protein
MLAGEESILMEDQYGCYGWEARKPDISGE